MNAGTLGELAPFLLIVLVAVVAATYYWFRWIFAVEKRLKQGEEQTQLLKEIARTLKERQTV